MAGVLSLALVSGTATAQSETAAMAPSSVLNGALPEILSEQDKALYRAIFDLQRDGHWQDADAQIAQLKDRSLIGHVLFQRYMHPTKYRSSFAELKAWMEAYADHPGASRIYDLAMRRRPANYKAPPRPRAVELPAMDAVVAFDDSSEAEDSDEPEVVANASRRFEGKSRSQRNQIRSIQRQIQSSVQHGNVTAALSRLATPANKRLFDPVSYADSLGVIVRGYYRYHYDDKAMAAAQEAVTLAGDGAARALWWGGLAAFRSQDWSVAASHFSALSQSNEADNWLKAAGGFWASRAYLIGGEPQHVSAMLTRAVAYPRTFYGLLATRALGETPPLDFNMPILTDTEVELLFRIPAVRRAIGLIETGQTELADTELRRFVDELPPSFAATLLALADKSGLADVAFRLGRDIQRRQGTTLDGALFPVPSWYPMEGYTVDRALIFAIVRQESQFRARAISRAGARGLMQLMPATAGFMAGERFRGASRAELFDPGLNLSLGQRYIRHVLELPEINGNLLYALTAYNAGPGNLQRWRAKIDYADDPLLFIESLPSRETRSYTEHVLANFWIYRLRLNQQPVSMDQMIGGYWPTYVTLEGSASPEDTRAVTVSAD